jgi:subtilisin-like proprotein convertase family protein
MAARRSTRNLANSLPLRLQRLDRRELPSTTLPFADGFESGSFGPAYDTLVTFNGRVEVSTANGPATGFRHAVLDASVAGTNSRSELTLRANLAGAHNALLSFKQKEFNDADHPMSASFVGAQDSDGVALSVDGVTWHRLVSLTGPASTNVYQSFAFNLSEFAASKGLTLGADTRIRFQAYGSNPAPGGGHAFDDIAVVLGGVASGKSFTDANADGQYTAGEAVNAGRLVYLDANNNGRFDESGGTIVTSGQVPAPLADLRRTLFPLAVTAGGVVTDARVNVNLLHTYAGDLQITLIHPDGARVALARNRGGPGDNFTNTTFDDAADTAIAAGAAPFTGRFRPESPLSALDGKGVFGTWYLEVTDTAAADFGTLLDWSLDLEGTSTNVENKAIPDNGTLLSSLQFAGFTGLVSDVDVTININHPYNADLDIFLQGPNGKSVELTTDNGPATANFTNTRFDDEAATPITAGTAPYTGRFRPEGKLSDLDGQALNGAWWLIVTDDAPADVGTLLNWSLHYTRTFAAPGAAPFALSGPTGYEITLPDLGGPITDLDVTIDATHTYVGDMEFYLTGPGGQKVTLSKSNGGSGDNFTDLRFDDEGPVSITSGWAPFTGRYRPETPLSVFDGLSAAGQWQLVSEDVASGDTGSLLNWSLDFRHGTRVASADVPKPIPDLGEVTSTLKVSGLTGPINDVNVTLDIAHTFAADVEVFLTAPNGRRVELFSDVGGSGDNFIGTTLDDEAALSITAGTAPFTGSYRPEGSLAQFDGLNPNGTWTLTVVDDDLGVTGTLTAWSILITTGERMAVTDAAGEYSFGNLGPGVYTVRELLPAGLKHTVPTGGFYSVLMDYSGAADGLDFGSIADTVAPTVVITPVSPDPRNTAVGSVQIVFSEPVIGFGLHALTLERGGAAVSLAGAWLSTADFVTWTLGNLTGLTGAAGQYQLTLFGPGSFIRDAAGNGLATAAFEFWTMDTTAPSVTGITRLSPPATADAQVQWKVTFSEAVTAPTAANFTLSGSGAPAAAITAVTGGGTTWTVTANTAGDGALGLDMVNSAGVADVAGNAVAPLPFFGESYSVNRPDIRVAGYEVNNGAAQRSRVESVTVRFDQVVNFAHLPEDAFTLTRVGPNTPVTFVAAVDHSGGVTRVTLQNFTGANAQAGSLVDGYYQLAVLPLEVFNANGVLDGNNDGISGDAYFTPTPPSPGAIFRLFGDVDGDRDVDAQDFGAFRGAFGGVSNLAFDADGDGDVDAADFGAFRARFGTSI